MEPFSANSPAPLFPWFTPSPQTERGKNKDKVAEEPSKERESSEKEKSHERDREREKENKRESRREKRKKGPEIQSGSALFLLGRVSKGKVIHEDLAIPSSAKKPTGRKKAAAADTATDVPAAALVDVAAAIKPKIPKKGRGGLEKSSLEVGLAAPSSGEKEEALRLPAAPSVSIVKHSTSSISSMLAHADKLPMTDKRVASLLKKAKAQLYKIEKSKSLKQVDQPKGQVFHQCCGLKNKRSPSERSCVPGA